MTATATAAAERFRRIDSARGRGHSLPRPVGGRTNGCGPQWLRPEGGVSPPMGGRCLHCRLQGAGILIGS